MARLCRPTLLAASQPRSTSGRGRAGPRRAAGRRCRACRARNRRWTACRLPRPDRFRSLQSPPGQDAVGVGRAHRLAPVASAIGCHRREGTRLLQIAGVQGQQHLLAQPPTSGVQTLELQRCPAMAASSSREQATHQSRPGRPGAPRDPPPASGGTARGLPAPRHHARGSPRSGCAPAHRAGSRCGRSRSRSGRCPTAAPFVLPVGHAFRATVGQPFAHVVQQVGIGPDQLTAQRRVRPSRPVACLGVWQPVQPAS